jgi:hypothetical protein
MLTAAVMIDVSAAVHGDRNASILRSEYDKNAQRMRSLSQLLAIGVWQLLQAPEVISFHRNEIRNKCITIGLNYQEHPSIEDSTTVTYHITLALLYM